MPGVSVKATAAITEAIAIAAHTSTAGTGERRLERASIASVASTPPARPPRWPPMEMLKPGKNVISRLMNRIGPRPEAMMSMPRLRAITIAAPSRPKIAVEAPTTGVEGSSSTAPNEPASSEAK